MDNLSIINEDGQNKLEVTLTDYAIITNPLLNKGMAFTEDERRELGLIGLLPPHVASIEEQRERSYRAFKSKATDLEKYLYLRDLQDSNETLFYNLLSEYITEMLPIVYTPTVGLGCEKLSHIYRRPRGIYIAYPYRDAIDQILAKPRFDLVEVIVVSDGERILGLGDQGAGGMGIPIGKLALYSACAGIHPAKTLPILLDVGTNNLELINDPLYIGWRHERVRGQAYDDFIEAFVQAVKKRFPHVLLQWEDFAQQNANPILDRYRDLLCTFNDDIQGTAAVATGALLAAVRQTGSRLSDQRIVIVGAGSAGCGISHLMMQVMMEEGLTEQEARSRFYLIDRDGLLLEDTKGLLPFQKKFTQSKQVVANWQCDHPPVVSLKDTIRNLHPTVLVGVSGQPAIFTEEIVKNMAMHVERPIIFPLSNPTARSEALPADLMKWTNGKVIMSTGSPFPGVDQTNNSYIFPGMGLGLITVKATHVTDKMFVMAAKALADCSPAKTDPKGNLLPPFTHIRDVSFRIAFAVAKEAIASGMAEPCSDDELVKRIQTKIWTPTYLPYKAVKLTQHR